jgi:hypothetical protein
MKNKTILEFKELLGIFFLFLGNHNRKICQKQAFFFDILKILRQKPKKLYISCHLIIT